MPEGNRREVGFRYREGARIPHSRLEEWLKAQGGKIIALMGGHNPHNFVCNFGVVEFACEPSSGQLSAFQELLEGFGEVELQNPPTTITAPAV